MIDAARGGVGTRPARRCSRPLVGLLIVALLAACGDSSVIAWRGLTVQLPQGWVVFEQRQDLLSLADGPLGEQPGDAGERGVAVQFTYDPGTGVDDVRELVTERGGVIDSEQQIAIDGSPATQLIYSFEIGDIPTREMFVALPSRSIVVLLQPVPEQGDTDAPEVFDDHLDELVAILESITLGAPPGAAGSAPAPS